jgi:hypothetical protein
MRDYQRVIGILGDPVKKALLSPEEAEELRRQAAYLQREIGKFAGNDGPPGGSGAPLDGVLDDMGMPQGPGASQPWPGTAQLPGQSQPSAPGLKAGSPSMKLPNMDLVGSMAKNVFEGNAWREDDFWGPLGQDDGLKAGFSESIALHAAQIAEQRGIRPDMAPLYVMESAKHNPRVFGFIARMSDVPDNQLRLIIKSRFAKLSDEEINHFMKLIDDDTAELLRRQDAKSSEARKAWDDFNPLEPR